jgi:hypothetical protein
MNPPDDERAKVNKRHKQIQPVLRNHPIEKVEKPALVEHGVIFHKPISIAINMHIKRHFRKPDHGMTGRRSELCWCRSTLVSSRCTVTPVSLSSRIFPRMVPSNRFRVESRSGQKENYETIPN